MCAPPAPNRPIGCAPRTASGASRDTLAAASALSDDDRAWFGKADRVGIRQVFMPDVLPATLVALFVACCSTCIFGTVGGWMPLYLSTEKHWSTAEYSIFYVFWGIVGFFGLCARRLARRQDRPAGRLHRDADRGRDFHDALGLSPRTTAAVDLWPRLEFRLPRFLGTEHDADGRSLPDPHSRRANGVVWAIAYFVGFVLCPFATVALQQATGSFALSFLCIPVLMSRWPSASGCWCPNMPARSSTRSACSHPFDCRERHFGALAFI